MFNYKKFSLPIIFTTFFSYSTNKTELPCANSRYSQCLNCFSYLLPAVYAIWTITRTFSPISVKPAPPVDDGTASIASSVTSGYAGSTASSGVPHPNPKTPRSVPPDHVITLLEGKILDEGENKVKRNMVVHRIFYFFVQGWRQSVTTRFLTLRRHWRPCTHLLVSHTASSSIFKITWWLLWPGL